MGTWIVADKKDIIKLTNSTFGTLTSTIEEFIVKSQKKYSENLLEMIEYMNNGANNYLDLDDYFANSCEDLNDFIHLVKLSVQEFLKNPYWNDEEGQKILQKMVGNLEEYYDKIKTKCSNR